MLESNPKKKTRYVSSLKCKKYENEFYRVVQNISKPEVLLIESEWVIEKNPKNYR